MKRIKLFCILALATVSLAGCAALVRTPEEQAAEEARVAQLVEQRVGARKYRMDVHFMTPEDAEEFGMKDKQIVSVKVNTQGRALIFGDVVVRVSPKYALAMHIDTDESNAAGAGGNVMGEIV